MSFVRLAGGDIPKQNTQWKLTTQPKLWRCIIVNLPKERHTHIHMQRERASERVQREANLSNVNALKTTRRMEEKRKMVASVCHIYLYSRVYVWVCVRCCCRFPHIHPNTCVRWMHRNVVSAFGYLSLNFAETINTKCLIRHLCTLKRAGLLCNRHFGTNSIDFSLKMLTQQQHRNRRHRRIETSNCQSVECRDTFIHLLTHMIRYIQCVSLL